MSIRRDTSDMTTHCFRSDHEIWREVMRSREKADQKHGENSIEQLPANSPQWLAILTEEVGEVAHELTYDATGSLRAELIDVMSVTSTWLAALDEESSEESIQMLSTGYRRPSQSVGSLRLTEERFIVLETHPHGVMILGTIGKRWLHRDFIEQKALWAEQHQSPIEIKPGTIITPEELSELLVSIEECAADQKS